MNLRIGRYTHRAVITLHSKSAASAHIIVVAAMRPAQLTKKAAAMGRSGTPLYSGVSSTISLDISPPEPSTGVQTSVTSASDVLTLTSELGCTSSVTPPHETRPLPSSTYRSAPPSHASV